MAAVVESVSRKPIAWSLCQCLVDRPGPQSWRDSNSCESYIPMAFYWRVPRREAMIVHPLHLKPAWSDPPPRLRPFPCGCMKDGIVAGPACSSMVCGDGLMMLLSAAQSFFVSSSGRMC